MATLYTLIIGIFGGMIGAVITDFVRTPFTQFFTLRRHPCGIQKINRAKYRRVIQFRA